MIIRNTRTYTMRPTDLTELVPDYAGVSAKLEDIDTNNRWERGRKLVVLAVTLLLALALGNYIYQWYVTLLPDSNSTALQIPSCNPAASSIRSRR